MQVTLQVVGLYYKKKLDINTSSGLISVKDVLDAAMKVPGNDNCRIYYSVGSVPGQQQYVDFILTRFMQEFSSPVSGTRYRPGTFSLRQTFTGLGSGNYRVWQYYVLNKNGVMVAQKPPEKPFGDALVVEDGFTVIWRLVEICNAIPVMQAGQTANVAQGAAPELYMNARLAKVIGEPAAKV